MNFSLHKIAVRATTLAATVLIGPLAHAITTPDPGDYVPAPAGVTIGVFYAQKIKGDDAYVDGKRAADNVGLKLDVGVARVVHYIKLGDLPADLQMILPFGRQRVESAAYRESGVGNLTVGGTVWSLSDATTGKQLGWSAFLSLPTGQNRDNGFFASDDRYALDLQVGYVQRLTSSLTLDLIGQTELYTRDRTTDVSRDPLVRGFAHLRYHLSPASEVALSGRMTFGAAEDRFGTRVSDSRRNGNVMLSWSNWLTPKLNLLLQYSKDVSTRNGVETQGVQTRLVYVL